MIPPAGRHCWLAGYRIDFFTAGVMPGPVPVHCSGWEESSSDRKDPRLLGDVCFQTYLGVGV